MNIKPSFLNAICIACASIVPLLVTGPFLPDLLLSVLSLWFLYYALNNETSFDYSWVKKRYGIQENSLEKVFEEYKSKKLFGNNMETGLGWCGFPDGMLEHSFERLPLMMTNHLNMEIKIVSKIDSPNISLVDTLVNSKIKNKEEYHYF